MISMIERGERGCTKLEHLLLIATALESSVSRLIQPISSRQEVVSLTPATRIRVIDLRRSAESGVILQEDLI